MMISKIPVYFCSKCHEQNPPSLAHVSLWLFASTEKVGSQGIVFLTLNSLWGNHAVFKTRLIWQLSNRHDSPLASCHPDSFTPMTQEVKPSLIQFITNKQTAVNAWLSS